MDMIERLRPWVAACAVTALAACGGGDGGSTTRETAAATTTKTTAAAADETEAAWLWIANEGMTFAVEGTQTVRFGAGSNWVEKSVSGSGQCTNAWFGRDPIYMTLKRCYLKASGAGADQSPMPAFTAPAAGTRFRAGTTMRFTGRAFDREDGWLTAKQLAFSAELHHDTHTHPFLASTAGSSVVLEFPVRGETSANIFYRVTLSATDSAGHVVTTTRDVRPQTATMRFETVPPGLALTLDGQPLATATVLGVVGIERDVGAADQVSNGRRYRFANWNDGGAAQHTIATPSADTTYTATFTDIGSAVNQAPSIALSAPAQATVGVGVSLLASASDSDGSVANVAFYENGTRLGSAAASPYGWRWTPKQSGRHELYAVATDDEGATARSAVAVIQVVAPPAQQDDDPPQASLAAPAAYASGLEGTIALEADASDNVGVSRVEFQIDGLPLASVTSAPWRTTLDATAHAPGQHLLRVRAHDAAGNVSAWSTTTVSLRGGPAVPKGFALDEDWITGLQGTTSLAETPDGRLLVAEQAGRLRVVKNGVLLAEPMLSVATSAVGERGLLGVALHPRFAENGWVYVYYTSAEGDAHNRISRFTASGDGAGSEEVLVDLPALSSATNHNGGAMHFGQDGKLYVGVGDNAKPANAQDMDTPLGKMLRFDDDGGIPADNPYASSATGLARAVWASGLRNPFTFAVQPGTGRIHINDVGQNTWEEINVGAPGANYGWPASEGPDGLAAGMTSPLFAYKHTAASPAGSGQGGFFVGFCIAGGAFYPSGGTFPAGYRQSYYFADYVGRFVGRLDLANTGAAYAFATLSAAPVNVLAGRDGALYVLTRGTIVRIAPG